VELVNAGVPVSELDRGLVDYFAGQYDVALAALDRHIAADLDSDGTARYYRALTLRELQRYQEAVTGLTSFINEYPDHPRWAEAWGDKAIIQWFNMGDLRTGAQTYLDFVAAAPARARDCGLFNGRGAHPGAGYPPRRSGPGLAARRRRVPR
jgi:soluble lytic murein transglycosylase